MTVECDDGKSMKLALCLSGGGYRAALFHLGALRRLHEIGWLNNLDVVSSVSGGSILSGFLIAKVSSAFDGQGINIGDFESELAAPFRTFTKNDLRTFQAIRNVTVNFVFRGGRLNSVINKLDKVFSRKPLNEIPDHPEFVFCATDMSFGVNWMSRRDKIGSYQAGYIKDSDWPLATAVATSACFPPVFGPYPVGFPPDEYKAGKYSGGDRDELLTGLNLTDGGVYDNLGLEPVWSDKNTIALVSDCGAPFDFRAVRKRKPWRTLFRYASLVQAQSDKLRVRMLHGRPKGTFAYWALRHSGEKKGVPVKGYSKSTVEDYIDEIRTDLDYFSDGEAKILENHGYAVAHHALSEDLADCLPADFESSFCLPHQEYVEDAIVAKELAKSGKRFVISRFWKTLFS